MIERWFFYQDGGGLWKWARLDVLGTILAHSDSTFDSRHACMEHARSNGYDEAEPGLPPRQDGPVRSALMQGMPVEASRHGE